jgi:hypothetical protein
MRLAHLPRGVWLEQMGAAVKRVESKVVGGIFSRDPAMQAAQRSQDHSADAPHAFGGMGLRSTSAAAVDLVVSHVYRPSLDIANSRDEEVESWQENQLIPTRSRPCSSARCGSGFVTQSASVRFVDTYGKTIPL